MRRRLYKGVPPQVRGQVWALLLDIEHVKSTHQGLYEWLAVGAPCADAGPPPRVCPQKMKEQAQVFSKDIRQIDLDVNRTFRNHIMFRDRYGVGQRALFHVLLAYSVYNPEVGYCQGMSEMVAILVMFLSEEDAFWALVQLMTMETHAMHAGLPAGSPWQPTATQSLGGGMSRSLDPQPSTQAPALGLYTPFTLTVGGSSCPPGQVTRLPLLQPPQEARTALLLSRTNGRSQGWEGCGHTLQSGPGSGALGRLTPHLVGDMALMVGVPGAFSGFFAPGFPKLARFQWHHDDIMEKELKGLKKHLASRRSPEALPSRPRAGDEQGMSAGLYTTKWFLQCFIGRTPFALTLKLWDAYMLDGERVLTAMAYTVLRLHRKRLLKLPLEGLQGFLQDTLAQPWALEDEAVLKQLRASMAHLRRRKCDLPPPAGPEEFPKMPLGQEQVSPAPTALLPSPTLETLSGADGLASPGPAAHAEQPGPLPRQAVIKAQQSLREGRSTRPLAVPLRPGAPGTPVLSRLPPQRCSSLPNLPGHQGGVCRGSVDMALRPQPWAPFPSAPAGATPVATPHTKPQNISGSPGTRSSQPRKEDAGGPRTSFLPWGLCSSCPFVAFDQPSRDTCGPMQSPQPQGPAHAWAPLTASWMGKVDFPRPLEKSLGAERLWAVSTVPCLLTLDFLEDGTPARRYKSLT
ncbi:uncharacterized protein LOC116880610 [Lontra canadensis]|uniref:uncharacterized protein LOC116880610 n=1 Tax=Lontra canadensis TaxID=76717 RepID=UPI0013F3A033|nr:uncharacterized protein LOC116880610 [Lontra canadensis]